MTGQANSFADAFDWAIVRLATYAAPSLAEPRLLFGSVSLLTSDRPRPLEDNELEHCKIRGGKSGKVFFKRTVLSAAEAIGWYREAGVARLVTPTPTDPSMRDSKKDGVPLKPTLFEDDPPWPSLGIPLGTDLFSNAGGPGDPAPFRGAGAPRIHRRFGDSAGFDAVIADEKVVRFLGRRLHFDLVEYKEYLGGLALIVPDPVLRHVQHFLVPGSEENSGERLVYRLVARPGQSLDNLTLTVLERRSNLLSGFKPVEVPSDGFVTVDSALPFDQTGYAISHPEHGVVAYQQPTAFFRSFRGTLGIAGNSIQVQFPRTESPRSPIDSYETTEYAHELPFGFGGDRQDAAVKVVSAENRRRRRAAAVQYKQTWFDGGQRQEAMHFVRRQLARAQKAVIVADPYFGARQIFQFLLAVPRTQIDFFILTSRLAFESAHAETEAFTVDVTAAEAKSLPDVSTEESRLKSFASSLQTLHKRGMKSVTTRVLTGTPTLHDRFLIIDDEVLFLGNSLNALGDRASLILSVPDGEPILAKLNVMADRAMPFEAYAAQRTSSKLPSSGGA